MSTAHTPAELVLGTAQLCDPQSSSDSRDESNRVILAALNAGVKWIETSPTYGHAETHVGQALRTTKRAHVITKLGPIQTQDGTRSIRELVTEKVSQTCSRLNVDRLEVLTLSSVTEIKANGGVLWRTLKELRNEGVIYDLGVAVASPDEAMIAIAEPAITYMQLQFNVLDRRWQEAGVIEALGHRPDILVHAHSALLYGMLAGTPGKKWPAIAAVDPEALRLTLWTMAKTMGRDCPADLCINYVRAQPWIHGVIAGAKSTSQLALNIARFKRPALTSDEIAQVNAVMPSASSAALSHASQTRAA